MSATTKLITAAEFFALPETGMRQELVYGEVVETMPPGGLHGKVAFRICKILDAWAGPSKAGEIGVESGFVLAHSPDLVRSPDAYFVRAERVPEGGVPEGFWQSAPDLAVEVVSPSDTAEEIRAKVREYLEAGSAAVWVVYPRTRELIAHTPDGLARTYAAGATLEMPALLPGLALAVSDIFA